MGGSGSIAKLAPVVRRRLHEEVVDQLVRAIHAGDFPVGARLPGERELSTIFGVTRPVIREALQSLERLGAVRIAQGERAEVLQVTPDLIATDADAREHFKKARLVAECGIARLAAERANDRNIRSLRKILVDQRAAKKRRQDFIAVDGEFHAGIAHLADNPLFTSLIRGIFNWLSGYHMASVSVPGREDLTLDEHAIIFDALEARDPEAAETAMRRHLTRANDLYRRLDVAPSPPKAGRKKQIEKELSL